TTYFVRVGALFSGATSYANTMPASTSTLANLLSSVLIYQVNRTSSTLDWTAFAVAPGTSTATGYELDASTMATFVPLWTSSTTTSVSLSTLTVRSTTRLTSSTT